MVQKFLPAHLKLADYEEKPNVKLLLYALSSETSPSLFFL